MAKNETKKKILIIQGPTSSGKTSLALSIVKEINGVIISADSRQIYKHMDIGTGKVPVGYSNEIIRNKDHWFMEGIKVFGYDMVNPGEYFSAQSYVDFAQNLIKVFSEKNVPVIVVGGTGFYIDALVGKIILEGGGPDQELRSRLEKCSLNELLDILEKNNSGIFNGIDKKNKVRVLRAVEKTLTPPEVGTTKKVENPLIVIPKVSVGLTSDRELLYKRADTWVDSIWENLLNETKALMGAGYEDTPQMKGLIYKTSVMYIKNQLNEKKSVERIKFDIHAYIRRQQTWFKRNPEIIWYDINCLSKEQIKADVIQRFFV